MSDSHGADAQLEELAPAIRGAFTKPVPEDVQDAHLIAMMQAVSDPSRMSAKPLPRRRRGFRLAAATATGFAMLSGLAFAGALPSAMQDALSDAAARAGFSLPVSAERSRADAEEAKKKAKNDEDGKGKSVSDDVHQVLNDDSLQGKEKGDAVSDVASQNRQNDERPDGSGTTETATDPPQGRGDSKKPNPPGKP